MAIIIHSYKCMYLVFTTYNLKKSFLRIIIAPPPSPTKSLESPQAQKRFS